MLTLLTCLTKCNHAGLFADNLTFSDLARIA